MAKRVRIDLIDDIDGGTADETVAFQIDGSEYEMDLSRANAAALRSTIEQWSPYARKVHSPGWRRGRRALPGPPGPAIRIWAQQNGYLLPARGRVPDAIRIAYRQAHPND